MSRGDRACRRRYSHLSALRVVRVVLVEFGERHDTRTNRQHYTAADRRPTNQVSAWQAERGKLLDTPDILVASSRGYRACRACRRGCYEETALVEFSLTELETRPHSPSGGDAAYRSRGLPETSKRPAGSTGSTWANILSLRIRHGTVRHGTAWHRTVSPHSQQIRRRERTLTPLEFNGPPFFFARVAHIASATCSYRSSSGRRRSVGRYVCPLVTIGSCGKTADSIEMPFAVVDHVGPENDAF